MRRLLSIILVVAVLGAMVAFSWLRARAAATDADLAARLEALAQNVEELARRVEAIEGAVPTASAPATLSVHAPARTELAAPVGPSGPVGQVGQATPPGGHGDRDVRWYLEQWVRSFDNDEEGAEYYRLLVDAHVLELVDALTPLLVEPVRPLAMRLAIARMLARTALRGDSRVLMALCSVLRQDGDVALADACVRAWGKVGVADALGRLEAVIWDIHVGRVREAAMRVLVGLAGDGANAVLLRLFASAPDAPAAAQVLHALDGGDLAAALAVFERASHASDAAVRLVAAQRIGEFTEERFGAYVDTWLGFERDPQVLQALGGAKKRQAAGADWSALQAVGPPDADPGRDDPKAWAPRDPQMGRQWLELLYGRAERATGVRIYEVNSPGAVSQVQARDAGGTWHTLWSGTPPAGTRPLTLTFPATDFPTQAIRVVLDTDRTSGWNEIDAVELLGAGGAQFAQRAVASSSYAQRQGNVPGKSVEFRSR
ncbi:MAG: hypothetical protein R3F56_06520 [Planctomycetota bacterium]